MEPIKNLLISYAELNSRDITEFDEAPSPLEFMRFVALNRPFVVRRGVARWKAATHWNVKYLCSAMRGQSIKVAVTPEGYVRYRPLGDGDNKPT
jgi:peptidyl-lysine (3S)-dioxygenase / protease